MPLQPAGIIGFVGLMVPHMVRRVVGPDHRVLLPAAALAGAAYLVLADIVARGVIKGVVESGHDPAQKISIFRIPGSWEADAFKKWRRLTDMASSL